MESELPLNVHNNQRKKGEVTHEEEIAYHISLDISFTKLTIGRATPF